MECRLSLIVLKKNCSHGGVMRVSSGAGTAVCFVRGQQGEQTVAGVCAVFNF